MVQWYWVLIGGFVGIFFGFVGAALCAAAGKADEEAERLQLDPRAEKKMKAGVDVG